ncbi:YdcH family protein [Gallaecimonas mangrovi]|uniref:YdcH family protein n=1 Tax=Gallaecimonas mangrovi TaxID=2291597 RepID=UPI000E203902|nr:YdcH family protein [Gallaecimonas mangrovi]
MSDNHSLYREFPNHIDRIQQLKSDQPDFARTAAEYHKLDHQIRGLQMRNQPVDDHTMKGMKMKRAQLKDELYHWLVR